MKRDRNLNILREGLLDPDALDSEAHIAAAKSAATGIDRAGALGLARASYGLSLGAEAFDEIRHRVNRETELVAPEATRQLVRALAAIAGVDALSRGRFTDAATTFALAVRCAEHAGWAAIHPDLPAQAANYLRSFADAARRVSDPPAAEDDNALSIEDLRKRVEAIRKTQSAMARRMEEQTGLLRWLAGSVGDPLDPVVVARELLEAISYEVPPNDLPGLIDKRYIADSYRAPERSSPGTTILQAQLVDFCPDLVQPLHGENWDTSRVLAILDQLVLAARFPTT